MYFILTRTVEVLHKINSVYFTSWCVYILPTTFAFVLLMNKEDLERKNNYGLAYLSFYIIIFVISDWLLNGNNTSKKDYIIKFLVIHGFLEHHCVHFAFKGHSGSCGKHQLSWLSKPLLTHPLTWHIIHVSSLWSCWSQTHCGILEFCAHGISWALCVNRAARNNDRYAYCTFLFS